MTFRFFWSSGLFLKLNFFPEKGNAFPKHRRSFRSGLSPYFRHAGSATAQTHTDFRSQNPIFRAQVLRPISGTEIAAPTRTLGSSIRSLKGAPVEHPPRTALVITICAHCKKVISETTQRDNRISHGICSKCLARLEKELPANSHPSANPHSSRSHLKKAREGSR